MSVTTPELAFVAEFARGLPEECRQVFTLRKVYGYTGREIAGRLGIPEHIVEAHLVHAARQCAYAASDAADRESGPSFLSRARSRIAHR